MMPTQIIDALTEKEKEALRLIVRGHDAKSVARTLDRSVHTINERLRDARRKLAVSSSREAARLLFEAEGEPPNPSGDTGLGEAGAASAVEQHGDTGRMFRPGWIVLGGIVMSLLLGLIALTALPQVAGHQAAPVETKDPAIVATARRFLTLGTQGDWAASYRMTTARFQSHNSLERWTEAAQHVRQSLGALKSRVLMSEQSIPAPPHGYQVVKFRSSFANKPNVVETVSLEREADEWKVAGVTVG